MRVYLNDSKGRRIVTVDVIRTNAKTVVVRLPDGNIIKRSKVRDVVEEVEK